MKLHKPGLQIGSPQPTTNSLMTPVYKMSKESDETGLLRKPEIDS